MWILRAYNSFIQTVSRQFPVVVLTGARQVGKTSLLRRLFPDHQYVSLDLPVEAEQAERSPETFLDRLGEPVIIDEFQYAPTLLRHIKARVDSDRGRTGRFLLTGSQHFNLMQNVSETLAGRCAVLQMESLSYQEVKAAKPLITLGEYQFLGGFPELHARDIDQEIWFGSYLATYLERDVRNVLRIGTLRDFDRFLRALAARSGQLLSLSDLARDVGVSPNSVKSWLSALETSGQVFLLEPYFRNVGKRLVKAPKVYFSDIGLLRYLMGYTSPSAMNTSPYAGQLFEVLVVSQLRRLMMQRGRLRPLWFYRDRSNKEVDIILERDGRLVLLEVKLTETPTQKDAKGLDYVRNLYGEELIAQSYIVCRAKRRYELADRVQVIGVEGLEEVLM